MHLGHVFDSCEHRNGSRHLWTTNHIIVTNWAPDQVTADSVRENHHLCPVWQRLLSTNVILFGIGDDWEIHNRTSFTSALLNPVSPYHTTASFDTYPDKGFSGISIFNCEISTTSLNANRINATESSELPRWESLSTQKYTFTSKLIFNYQISLFYWSPKRSWQFSQTQSMTSTLWDPSKVFSFGPWAATLFRKNCTEPLHIPSLLYQVNQSLFKSISILEIKYNLQQYLSESTRLKHL